MSIRFISNLKAQLRTPVLKNDGVSVLGGLIPMLVGTALNVQGWTGWGVSYGVPYILAKGMNWDNVARGIAAVGVAHLGWTVGTPYVEKVFGHGPWRMGNVTLNNSVVAMNDEIPAGESVASLPGIKTYPAAELAPASSMSNSVTAMSNSVTAMDGLLSPTRGGRNAPSMR